MAKDTTFKPFVPDHDTRPELSFVPLLLGVVLGIVFGASSLYLALKVGMTVSASIPVAVLSITVLKACSKLFRVRQATILENNIVQTTGSAGESLSFGVAVTLPALMILGFEMELSRAILAAVLGGLLGILMMIPLRRALIASGDKTLVYPEGRACAEVLIAGEQGGTSAKTVFTGFFLGMLHKVFGEGFRLWPVSPEKHLGFFKGATLGADMAPELLGVGYIIGPRVAAITVAGGILSWLVLIPAITLFGSNLSAPLFPATKLISEMGSFEIWKAYVLYIGAGAVAGGGIVSLIRSLPIIIRGATSGLKGLKKNADSIAKTASGRTDIDLPMSFVAGGAVALVAAIWLIPTLGMNLMGALLIVVFGFLFVLVSSRLTGEIGSSSNPISGMTVATLLFTSLIFLALGWTAPEYRVTALTVAAIVCIAASNAGTTSQDLKTGHIVGATPKYQQIAILVGSLTSAIVIGYTLDLLNKAKTIYAKRDYPAVVFTDAELTQDKFTLTGPESQADGGSYRALYLREPRDGVPAGKYFVNNEGRIAYLVDPGINGQLKTRDDGSVVEKYEAPKARLMSLIIDGILAQKLPWGLVMLGFALVLVLELCGVASLPFAVGVYLPLSVSMPIFFGGAIRWIVEYLKKSKEAARTQGDDAAEDASPGVLLSSGLIAGASIGGVALAFSNFAPGLVSAMDMSKAFPLSDSNSFALIVFGGLMAFTLAVGAGKLLKQK
jgi:putative OPT family oligopeptide transporter